MEFNENLVQLRKQQGMSQEDLAQRLDISRQAISKWETGDALPDLYKLSALADILGVGLDDLCGREAPKAPSAPTRKSLPLWVWLSICGVCLVLGLLIGLLIPSAESPAPEQTVPPLPDALQVNSWQISCRPGSFSCSYVPSIAQEGLSYQMLLLRKDSQGQSEFQLEPDGGVYRFEKENFQGGFPGVYDLYAVISNGQQTQRILLAVDLRIGDNGGISWAEPN